MTSRNISVTEDVYALLTKMKLKDESFSDTIKRLAKRHNLTDYAGLWSNATEEDMKAFNAALIDLRARARDAMRENNLEVR